MDDTESQKQIYGSKATRAFKREGSEKGYTLYVAVLLADSVRGIFELSSGQGVHGFAFGTVSRARTSSTLAILRAMGDPGWGSSRSASRPEDIRGYPNATLTFALAWLVKGAYIGDALSQASIALFAPCAQLFADDGPGDQISTKLLLAYKTLGFQIRRWPRKSDGYTVVKEEKFEDLDLRQVSEPLQRV